MTRKADSTIPFIRIANQSRDVGCNRTLPHHAERRYPPGRLFWSHAALWRRRREQQLPGGMHTIAPGCTATHRHYLAPTPLITLRTKLFSAAIARGEQCAVRSHRRAMFGVSPTLLPDIPIAPGSGSRLHRLVRGTAGLTFPLDLLHSCNQCF